MFPNSFILDASSAGGLEGLGVIAVEDVHGSRCSQLWAHLLCVLGKFNLDGYWHFCFRYVGKNRVLLLVKGMPRITNSKSITSVLLNVFGVL